MSTLVGTAPNIIFVGFIQETYGIEISFVDWMKLGVPLAILMLGASWYAITKIVYPVHFIASIETKLQLQNMLTDLGPRGRDEKKVLIIFSLAASAWMFRTLLDNFVPLSGLTDAGIAIFAALSFFFIPSENAKTVGGNKASKKSHMRSLTSHKGPDMPGGLPNENTMTISQ